MGAIAALSGSVVDPEWFFSDPDPTFHTVSDPIPDPDPLWIFCNNLSSLPLFLSSSGSDQIRIHYTAGSSIIFIYSGMLEVRIILIRIGGTDMLLKVNYKTKTSFT